VEHIYKVCRPLIGTRSSTSRPAVHRHPRAPILHLAQGAGGALADLAVLVIDINEGLKPQTIESISILKRFKTPFIIAMNKIDLLEGWQTTPASRSFSATGTDEEARTKLDERMYKIIGTSMRRDTLGPLRSHRGLHQGHPIVLSRPGTARGCLIFCLSSSASPALPGGAAYDRGGTGSGTILEVKEEKDWAHPGCHRLRRHLHRGTR